ncbi:hypothetical protein [Mucilaginibacter sp. SG564]|uniref:hypothetical protein n=1 Tax=Mucilaginibacter sp. SG564 TaxID=2587022 RepID=UPI00352F5D56
MIKKSHGSEVVSQILKLVTAAVVGVILNLTLFLGKDVVFPVVCPGITSMFCRRYE